MMDEQGIKDVAFAASWMDENFPGWEREIDLGKFKLMDCEECVLGQVLRDKVKNTQYGRNGFDFGVARYSKQFDYGLITWDQYCSLDRSFATSSYERIWMHLLKERWGSGTLSDDKGIGVGNGDS